MHIEVYCDEAYPDLFSSRHPQAHYLIIGGIWLNSENRDRFKTAIHNLRDLHKIGGEFKWTKVSPSKKDFYKDLLIWFFEQGEDLRFRCIAIDHKEVDLIRFHQSDQELGFYKFYYQMLHHWIHSFNSYQIFCDFKRNRFRDRLHTLQACLSHSNLAAVIETVQAVRSKESVMIQLSDFLVGAVAASLNGRLAKGSAKAEIVSVLEASIGHKIAGTALCEKKFNIFKINLGGGW